MATDTCTVIVRRTTTKYEYAGLRYDYPTDKPRPL